MMQNLSERTALKGTFLPCFVKVDKGPRWADNLGFQEKGRTISRENRAGPVDVDGAQKDRRQRFNVMKFHPVGIK